MLMLLFCVLDDVAGEEGREEMSKKCRIIYFSIVILCEDVVISVLA